MSDCGESGAPMGLSTVFPEQRKRSRSLTYTLSRRDVQSGEEEMTACGHGLKSLCMSVPASNRFSRKDLLLPSDRSNLRLFAGRVFVLAARAIFTRHSRVPCPYGAGFTADRSDRLPSDRAAREAANALINTSLTRRQRSDEEMEFVVSIIRGQRGMAVRGEG